jgi:HK97 family phage major capsid protein/HK97 family phage prohead protease
MAELNNDLVETRKLKLKSLSRAGSAEIRQIGEDESVFTFPFSSELAVERWFGDEILSHEADAADLSRLNDAAPVLWNHNRDDQIGVVEKAWMGNDKRGYCNIRFGTSPMAQQILSDVRAGVIRNVSFGYRINDLVESKKSGGSVFTATHWTPLEVSLVSIPADPTVGLGRDDTEDAREVTVRGIPVETREENTTMTTPAPAAAPVDVSAIREEARQAEFDRVTTIRALAEKFPAQAEVLNGMITNGRSIEDARAAVLESMGARQVPVASSQAGAVDLSEREQREYSLVRAINASISGDWSNAGLEREASIDLARQMGRETNGFFMPTNLRMETRASYAVGAAATGGNLVATELLASSFIEVLRNKALIMNLGPTVLSGLTGNVAIPRQNSATATYWVTEGTAITEAEATFDQVTLTPRQLGALSEYSRLALQQATPGIEALVRNDLARVMALGVDAAAINGSGASGQPKGILNQSGIGSVAMGTNGSAFLASSTTTGTGIDQLIDLEKLLDVANALDGSLSYLTNAKGVAAMKKLKDQYGDYIWGNSAEDLTGATAGSINGYRVARSNQVPSNLVKGTSGAVCSAVLFGDFSQLVIGMWGGLEILPNPYDSTAYTKGAVRIRAMQTVDIAVRHAESFAAITDLLTP